MKALNLLRAFFMNRAQAGPEKANHLVVSSYESLSYVLKSPFRPVKISFPFFT